MKPLIFPKEAIPAVLAGRLTTIQLRPMERVTVGKVYDCVTSPLKMDIFARVTVEAVVRQADGTRQARFALEGFC